MSKSYVTLEQKVCPVCGITHDTGSLLLDTHLKEVFNQHTVTGYDLCEEHQKLSNDGYLHLVVAANNDVGESLTVEEANRTGEVISIRRTLARDIFDVDIPETQALVFVEPGVAEALKQLAAAA